MTDQTAASPSTGAQSPGALLRAAREQRGVHLAALAGAIKVAPAKLEALEADDYSGMPDTTFARALAQAVCRSLKVDPVPVLALMPESFHTRLERVDEGINAPFRERPGGLGDFSDRAVWRHPVVWLAGLLLIAAAAFVWWPRPEAVVGTETSVEPMAALPDELASAPLAELNAADGSASAPALVAEPVASAARLPILADADGAARVTSAATVPAGGAVPPSQPAAASADGAELRALQDTWVQVSDSAGKTVLARTVPAGETLAFNGPWPMKFRIGNVQGTELRYRGQALALKTMTSDNTLSLSVPLSSP